MPDDLITEALDRLDRIEQILREMGRCDCCHLAHKRGIRSCKESALMVCEEKLTRIIKNFENKDK